MDNLILNERVSRDQMISTLRNLGFNYYFEKYTDAQIYNIYNKALQKTKSTDTKAKSTTKKEQPEQQYTQLSIFDNITESVADNAKLLAEKDRIKDVIDIMSQIKYGFISKADGKVIDDREWIHNNELKDVYEVNTDPLKTLEDGLGICQDQAILIKYLMNTFHPEDTVKLYAVTKSPKGHCAVAYEHKGKWFYLETSWDKERGLHGVFNSEEEVKNYIKNIYLQHHEYDTPESTEVNLRDYECQINESILDKYLSRGAYLLNKDGTLIRGIPDADFGYVHPTFDLEENETSITDLRNAILKIEKEFIWYKQATKNEDVKNKIEILLKKSIWEANDLNKLISEVDYIINSYQREFIEFRFGEARFDGNNNCAYFRIRSFGYNWFDVIWMFALEHKHQVKYITIERYESNNRHEFKYDLSQPVMIHGKPISMMEVEEFLAIEGNPVIESLHEDTRNQLISTSRNADYYKNQKFGKNRFERKRLSKVATQVKNFNTIDMNQFFKQDILEINIPVYGEHNNYTVTIRIDGVVAELARNVKSNQNKFEYKSVIQALTKVFNTADIKVKCTCADFCLHKDTEIKLLDGRVLTVEKLLEEFNKNKNLYLYSVNKDGDFVPGKINNVWISNYTSDMIKITLDNGKDIITTPEHKYLLRTNEYKMAKDLAIGQSLMPLYFSETENGYETVKSNSESGTKFYSVYKIIANKLLQKEIEEAKIRSGENIVSIHHKDFNKNNNNPSNLYPMGFNEHYKYHYEHVKGSPTFEKFKAAGEEYRELVMDHTSEEYKKQASVIRNAIINYYNNLSEDELSVEKERRSAVTKNAWENGCFNTQKWKAAAKQRGIDMHTPEREALARAGIQKKWDSMSTEERKNRVANSTKTRLEKYTKEERSELTRKGYYTICRKVLEYLIENNIELTEENYYKYKNIVNKKAPKIHTLFSSFNEAISYFKLNHKIINIEYIHYDKPIPVYDIEVDAYNNFYVDAGVILHNCYRYQHQLIINNNSVDGSDKDPGPGRTGMANTSGKGCKHVLLALANMDWVMKVSSCIKNYITYMDENKHQLFIKVIFPKLYGITADDAIKNNLVPDDTDIETDKNTIETINNWAKQRGKIKAGTNVNPVTGTGGRAKKLGNKEIKEENK